MSKQIAKKDYDRDGKKESSAEEYKGSKDRAIKSAKTKKGKKFKKMVKLKEAADIGNFIASISTKKYALAHKYLKQVIEDKLKARITSSLNTPLF
jgi:hypothetical protein